jgi:glyoxylase-like metal-dependent hydrolase (beta-lactamase superfamily II)
VLPAEEFQQVRDGLWCWQRYQPAVKVDCSSVALRVGTELIFVDPIPLAAEALAELAQFGEPAAIVVTNANHDRAVQKLRDAFRIPVLAHAEAASALGFAIDRTITDGEVLFETLTVIALPGAVPGEIALHDARGWMLVGDAIINLEPDGLALLPAKYCDDAREMRESLRKLLRFPFEVLTFAHGLPLVSRARSRLEDLLA